MSSTREYRRHRLQGGELAATAAVSARLAQHGRARDARRDLLEQLQPFSARAVFELRQSRWHCRRAATGCPRSPHPPDRNDCAKTIGTVRVACSSGATQSTRQDDRSAPSASNCAMCLATARRVAARARARFDPQIAPVDPAQIAATPARNAAVSGLSLRIAFSRLMSVPTSPHALAMLRSRRKRPRRSRTAEELDELASPHSITSSARASSVGGTSMPSALAVLRLMAS